MILFRSDIDAPSGADRFNRSLYLAAMLRHRVPVAFCTEDAAVSRLLKGRNFPFFKAAEVMARPDAGFRALVFDLENFAPRDQDLLQWARDQSLKTVQVTDLGLNRQPVDVIIDAALDPMKAYGPDEAGLFGPGAAILHTRFRHFHRTKKKVSRTVKKLFMCPGGKFDYRGLRAWAELLTNHGFRVKIFPEPWMKKSHRKALKRKYSSLKFTGRAESRARPFFEADLALVPADRAAYEAAACGTPALYFCSGPEEEFQADRFQERGCGIRIGSEPPGGDIVNRIRALDAPLREEMSARGKEAVDARGIFRIVDFFIKQAII